MFQILVFKPKYYYYYYNPQKNKNHIDVIKLFRGDRG